MAGPGTTIAGKYRLEAPLGGGGFGAVWRATRLDDGAPVAVKFLRTANAQVEARFEREARALGRLDHPNCLRLLDFGRSPEGPYLVTPIAPGVNLRDWAAGAPDRDAVLEVLRQITLALDHAHRLGLIHRDLKPENILVDGTAVTVLDFGLAKFTLEPGGDITKTGEVWGTPGYMSPEQLRGLADASAPSDLYSLGVIAYELLEGRPPFQGASAMDLAMQHVLEPVPPLRRTTGPLADLVTRLLAKSPHARPRSARAVLDALDAELEGRVAPQDARFRPRRGGLGLAIAAVVLLAAVAWYASDEDEAGDSVPAPPTRRALPDWKEAPPKPAALPARDPTLPPGCDEVLEPGPQRFTIQYGAHELGSRVYVPSGYSADKPLPVLFVLHEGGSSPTEQLREMDLEPLADQHGFLIVAPEDELRGLDRTKKWSEVNRATTQLARELPAHFCADADRIYLIGHGGGGRRADEVARSGAFAAVVFSSHRFSEEEAREYQDQRSPIPALFLAPTQDLKDPVEGGKGAFDGAECRGAPVVSLREHVARLRTERDCTGETDETAVPGATCRRHACAVPLVTCEIAGGRHWPGHVTADPCEGVPGEFAYQTAIWEFLRDHRRVRPPGCGEAQLPGLRQISLAGAPAWVDVPASYDPEVPSPVLIALHERGQSARGILEEIALDEIAEEQRMILVAPDWKAPVNDLEAIHASVHALGADLCVDEQRIFWLSHGHGGEALQELLCAGKAIDGAIISSYRAPADAARCARRSGAPLLFLAPTDDPLDPVAGGPNCELDVRPSLADHEGMLRRRQRCTDVKPAVSTYGESTCYAFSCGAPLISCHIDGGRHWPGWKQTEKSECSRPAGDFPYQQVVGEFLAGIR